jgi:hypothetical protein
VSAGSHKKAADGVATCGDGWFQRVIAAASARRVANKKNSCRHFGSLELQIGSQIYANRATFIVKRGIGARRRMPGGGAQLGAGCSAKNG